MLEEANKQHWEYIFPPFRAISTDGDSVAKYMSGDISRHWRSVRAHPQAAEFLNASGQTRLRYTEWPAHFLDYSGVPGNRHQYLYIQEPWFLHKGHYYHASMPELWPISADEIKWKDNFSMPRHAAYSWLRLADAWLVKAHDVTLGDALEMGFASTHEFERQYREKMESVNGGRLAYDTNPVIWLLKVKPAYRRNFAWMAQHRQKVYASEKIVKGSKSKNGNDETNLTFPIKATREDIKRWDNAINQSQAKGG